MQRFPHFVAATARSVLMKIRWCLPAVWYLLAAVLIAWACVYVWIQFKRQPLTVLWYVVGFGVVMWLMFFGEGTEIAYTTLHDKDPEQVPEFLQKGFAKLVKSDQVGFISGRQLLVVFAIVGMTLLCELVSDVGSDDPARPYAQYIETLADFRYLFTLLFPSFFAFWFAQLPSKMIAHESALMAYRWAPMRWAMTWSMFIGNGLRVEGPSKPLKELVARSLRRGDEDVLKPSRAFNYKTSAMLRDGKGIEEVHIQMWIGSGGSIDVRQSVKIHAYARGVRKISEQTLSEAPIKPGAKIAVACPVSAFHNGPTAADSTVIDGTTFFKWVWDVQLKAQDLPIGHELDVEVQYATDDGAMKYRPNEKDEYDYTVRYVPTKKVVFDVMARPNNGFMFVTPTVIAITSENPDINWQEAKRVVPSEIVDDESGSFGFRYAVDYPLLNTKFTFGWSIEPAAIAISTPNLSQAALPPPS